MERTLQNFGAIRKFESTFIDRELGKSDPPNDRLYLSFDLSFQNEIFSLLLCWSQTDFDLRKCESLAVPKFNLLNGRSELLLVFDGLLNFWQQYGLKEFVGIELVELESYLREENHIPVIEKTKLNLLGELYYNFQLMLEEFITRLVVDFVAAEKIKFRVARDLEKLFNKHLERFAGASIELLDRDEKYIIYRYRPVLNDGNWKKLWSQVIQKLANNLVENNGRQWVDKPWY